MVFSYTGFPPGSYPERTFPALSFPGYTRREEEVVVKKQGGRWFKGKKELEALESRILREDEELIEIITSIVCSGAIH